MYKPENYTCVSPYLVVSDARGTIDFLVRVFGAEELSRHTDPANDSRIMHAEVRIDDSIVMLADGNDSWPPLPCNVHVYVADVDAVYERALSVGAESIQEPMQKDDPDRRCGVRDVGGTAWWIATRAG